MSARWFTCATCGSDIMLIFPKTRGWKLTCGNGHVLVPVPGTEYITAAPCSEPDATPPG